eukprot:Lithocolla_globosa_v1_NODE_2781_length_1870_cov_5.496419.p3 type:complete len:151 gc:universal NODE_2781_length_1870_cov_5.496419:275-727(+)
MILPRTVIYFNKTDSLVHGPTQAFRRGKVQCGTPMDAKNLGYFAPASTYFQLTAATVGNTSFGPVTKLENFSVMIVGSKQLIKRLFRGKRLPWQMPSTLMRSRWNNLVPEKPVDRVGFPLVGLSNGPRRIIAGGGKLLKWFVISSNLRQK